MKKIWKIFEEVIENDRPEEKCDKPEASEKCDNSGGKGKGPMKDDKSDVKKELFKKKKKGYT